MGWTAGYGIAAPRDMARFFYDLLGPEPKIVSKESVEVMKNFTPANVGWGIGYVNYGGGLMLQWFGDGISQPGTNSSFIGHGGMTYGFIGNSGYNKALGASISIATNQGFDEANSVAILC